MTHTYYPVALDLAGKECLVVGGGGLALEKIHGLLRAGARVTAVAPEPLGEIAELEAGSAVSVRPRDYHPDDLNGIYLAYGASEDRELNARVALDARARGILVNAVDDIPHCDFFAVALVRRGDLQIAISTNGRSPAFARWMREYLDSCLPDQLGEVLDVMGCARDRLRSDGAVPPYDIWREAIDNEVFDAVHTYDRDEAQARVMASLQPAGTGSRGSS